MRAARLLLALGIASGALLATSGTATAADRPAPRGWRLTFTPTSVRSVGDPIPRSGVQCAYSGCAASWAFTTAGVAGQRLELLLRYDEAACSGLPCDLPPRDVFGTAYHGVTHFDGTTYTGTGRFHSHDYCDGHFTGPEDSFAFTSTDGEAARGTATLVLSWVGPTSGQKCVRVGGYEVYEGTLTGSALVTGAAASTPGAPAAVGGPAVRAPLSAAGVREVRADRLAARAHTRPAL